MSIGFKPATGNKPSPKKPPAETVPRFRVRVLLDDDRDYTNTFDTEEDAREYAAKVCRIGLEFANDSCLAYYPAHRVHKVIVDAFEEVDDDEHEHATDTDAVSDIPIGEFQDNYFEGDDV